MCGVDGAQEAANGHGVCIGKWPLVFLRDTGIKDTSTYCRIGVHCHMEHLARALFFVFLTLVDPFLGVCVHFLG